MSYPAVDVLRGQMSLVGPRPLIPAEDEQVIGWHRRGCIWRWTHWSVAGDGRTSYVPRK